jgi:hypothetical protein
MITPSDSASSPGNYAQVAVQPMNIQAPLMDAEITASFDAANAVEGTGVLYPVGPRQMEARQFMDSPQGFGGPGFDIDAGYHGDGGDGWPADIEPGA